MALQRRSPMPRASKPIARGAPLAQGKPLTRGAGLSRSTSPPSARTLIARARAADQSDRAPTRAPITRAPIARRPEQATEARTARPAPARRNTGASTSVREQVRIRDGGLCVRCGAPAGDLDHRQGRGAGGTKGAESARINGVAWLTTLCGLGNTDPSSCHGWKEARREDAERDGYRVARNGLRRDAALVPIRTRFGWVLHTADGRRVSCAAPPNEDARDAPAGEPQG